MGDIHPITANHPVDEVGERLDGLLLTRLDDDVQHTCRVVQLELTIERLDGSIQHTGRLVAAHPPDVEPGVCGVGGQAVGRQRLRTGVQDRGTVGTGPTHRDGTSQFQRSDIGLGVEMQRERRDLLPAAGHDALHGGAEVEPGLVDDLGDLILHGAGPLVATTGVDVLQRQPVQPHLPAHGVLQRGRQDRGLADVGSEMRGGKPVLVADRPALHLDALGSGL